MSDLSLFTQVDIARILTIFLLILLCSMMEDMRYVLIQCVNRRISQDCSRLCFERYEQEDPPIENEQSKEINFLSRSLLF